MLKPSKNFDNRQGVILVVLEVEASISKCKLMVKNPKGDADTPVENIENNFLRLKTSRMEKIPVRGEGSESLLQSDGGGLIEHRWMYKDAIHKFIRPSGQVK